MESFLTSFEARNTCDSDSNSNDNSVISDTDIGKNRNYRYSIVNVLLSIVNFSEVIEDLNLDMDICGLTLILFLTILPILTILLIYFAIIIIV